MSVYSLLTEYSPASYSPTIFIFKKPMFVAVTNEEEKGPALIVAARRFTNQLKRYTSK